MIRPVAGPFSTPLLANRGSALDSMSWTRWDGVIFGRGGRGH